MKEVYGFSKDNFVMNASKGTIWVLMELPR